MAILLGLDRIPVFVATITLLMATVIQRGDNILVLLMTLAANAGSREWIIKVDGLTLG